MINLSVAVVIDDDIAAQVRSSKSRCTRATYDISVVEALRRIYRKVTLIDVVETHDVVIEQLLKLRPDVVFNLAYSSHPL